MPLSPIKKMKTGGPPSTSTALAGSPMLLILVTSAVSTIATASPGSEKRRRGTDPPTVYKDVKRSNDLPTDENADSIGKRNAADAVAMVSRNESNNRGRNRPTASSNDDKKNTGGLGQVPL